MIKFQRILQGISGNNTGSLSQVKDKRPRELNYSAWFIFYRLQQLARFSKLASFNQGRCKKVTNPLVVILIQPR